MTTVSHIYAQAQGRPLFICDFSPPRGADLSTVEQVKAVAADLVCVAYSPGKSVRVDPVALAHQVQKNSGPPAVFNLACRDMNRLALQNYLLGAQVLGLENVLVVKGDPLSEEDRSRVREVNDYQPVELIQAIKSLNEGLDFRGSKLRVATSFCVGAALDLSVLDLEQQARLAERKLAAGADFFLTQAFHDVAQAGRFHDSYVHLTGKEFPKPIFYGVQILARDGLTLSQVPESMLKELEMGRPPTEMALETVHALVEKRMTTIYLIPPILRGGRRDYEAASHVVRGIAQGSRALGRGTAQES